MSTPRRRPTGGIRRPQVAGRPRTGRTDHDHDGSDAGEEIAARTGGVALDERAGPDEPTVAARAAAPVRTGAADEPADRPGDAPDGTAEAGEKPRRPLPLPAAPTTRKGAAALLAVTVLLTAAAAFFGYQWYGTAYTGSAANTALTDVGTTAEVSQQIGEAVTKVYSFDHARLQQAEEDARAVITPAFQPEFDRIFGSVKQLAPQQQAVVTATIPKSAVASIDGDRATVYVFVNQVIRRQAAGAPPQEGAAAARLRVDAELVDGRWKIAAMTPA
ncbi:nuclear transport factor 2 family protein [Pseudonocardia sp. C8]|uniref:nuclear transport factor 2 family protein n=1 Tax=Pseudonocardia sp. C8 TaxID=2762759 RepID=UPI001642FC0D|nr:nuclear transport factor 2 family protein [Pseudonocardia sp. C8]MBC3189703.1 nuclear transport factor 2 family protein [Pseudonocardia sp. C8]